MGLGIRIQVVVVVGFRVNALRGLWGSRFRVQGFTIWAWRVRVWGWGLQLRVACLGFRAQGVDFRT